MLDEADEVSGLRWLYIDFNSYFASVEQQLNPTLRGRPVIVIPVETASTCAIAASYGAKALGIRTGTMVREARQKCPDLIEVLARHDVYVAVHRNIMQELGRHFPVTKICSIDEAAYRLMLNDRPEAAALSLARQVKRGLAENIGEYVRCSIGIAPNLYLAKIAADMHKPDGLTVLHSRDLPHRLHPLALRDLMGVGANMERRLLESGVADVRTLLTLPPERLRAIWGNVWGERLWSLLRGVDLPEQTTKRHSVGHSHVLAPALRGPKQARDVARRLTLKAASRMRRYGYHASGMLFSASLENGPRFAYDERCWRAKDSGTFLKMLDGLWARMVAQGGDARLKKLSITLHRLTPDDAVAPDLLDMAPPRATERRKRNEALSAALDRLNHTYGRDTVVIGMLPSEGRSFSGTKVAFTRIPDLEEFQE